MERCRAELPEEIETENTEEELRGNRKTNKQKQRSRNKNETKTKKQNRNKKHNMLIQTSGRIADLAPGGKNKTNTNTKTPQGEKQTRSKSSQRERMMTQHVAAPRSASNFFG